jgi:transcription initiation factor TFIIB
MERARLDKCPECGSTRIIRDYDSGEAVCGDCGLVVEEHFLDEGPETRAFSPEDYEERLRTGLPEQYSIFDKGLTTSIDVSGEDASGKKLPAETYFKMKRLSKWQVHSRVYSSANRDLAQAMVELDRLCDALVIPQATKEQAAVIYRKALDKGIVRGRSIASTVAASLYAACRTTGVERSLRAIAEASLAGRRLEHDGTWKRKKETRASAKVKEVSRCYRLILKEVSLEVPLKDPVTCLKKVANEVGASGEAQGLAAQIILKARERHLLLGKEPHGVAAAALYLACVICGEDKTQKQIADAAGVTEVTVRNRYKQLSNGLGLSRLIKEAKKASSALRSSA